MVPAELLRILKKIENRILDTRNRSLLFR